MKKHILILLLLAAFMAGCSRNTMVYIPEETLEMETGVVVYIPVRPTEETESQPTELAPETEPAETEPEQKYSSTISSKPSTSSNKGSSSDKGQTNKGTITGSSSKPAETEPAATEPTEDKHHTTVTVPVTTEPSATEPPATQPPETEPPLYDISCYVVGNLEYAILNQINAHRTDAELDELQMDEQLCAIASCRSYEVSLVWSHTRPDGRSFATVLSDYGYGADNTEELLIYALGFADGTVIADRWMQSDSHRQLLLGSWSTAGIGVYDTNGYIYVACLLVG